MPEVHLIAKRNTQGYFMNLLLSRAWSGYNYTVHFTDARDVYSALQEKDVPDNTKRLFIVGLPFWSSQYNAISELLTSQRDPQEILKIYHFATFGDSFPDEEWQGGFFCWYSYVDEVVSPVQKLTDMLLVLQAEGNSSCDLEEFFSINEGIIRLIDQYHRYEFEPHTQEYAVDLVDLGNLLKECMPRALSSHWTLGEIMETYHHTLTGLRSTRNQCIQLAIKRTRATVINSTVICFLYAEQYPNEIAHKLIDFYRQHNYEKVIVFVGKHTKGDDMFSVRSYGVDASEVAYRLNRGKGKPNTATVFLGNSGNATYNATIQSLSEIL